jgi:uncharacterized membrane protein
MTTLRFVGDVPLWVGLLAALVVCVLSWRYYSRESFGLPRRLRWLLPLLRSAAFLLGILVLTGPVLHHRTILGELGRVKIYVDDSRSMTMQDRHMSTGRKLLVAEQLGWISAGRIDSKLLKLADQLSEARQGFVDAIAPKSSAPAGDPGAVSSDAAPPAAADPKTADAATANPTVVNAAPAVTASTVRTAVDAFRSRLLELKASLPSELSERYQNELLQPLDVTASTIDADAVAAANALVALAKVCETLERSVRSSFEAEVSRIVESGDESIRSALAMFDETPRWRRVEMGLSESSAKILEKLREQHDVEVLRLAGEKAELLGSRAPNSADGGVDEESDGENERSAEDFSSVTDLSSGIVATQKSVTASENSGDTPSKDTEAAESKTAIVLITDGQHNSGPSPLQTAQVLGSQGVPFFSVSLGASQQAADLAVIGLEHPDLVFQKDHVRGVMVIRDQMTPGKPFVAQISYQDEVLWQQQLVTQNVAERRIEFDFEIDELVTKLGAQFASDIKQHAVPLEFQASIAALPEESETDNNQRAMRLAAIVSSYKVLLIDGRSRWETRYLRNVFERDEQWSINTVIVGPGTDHAGLTRGAEEGQFPGKREELFAYDLVIFGEVAPELFNEQDFQWLSEFVETRGGGIVFIDGQRGRLRQLASTKLGSLIPVEWLNETISAKPTSLQLTDKGASESALRLSPDAEQNRRFWTELPPPHSLVAVNALPGAEVLIEANVDGRQRPAMVTRLFGSGRVVYLAFDESWRWRFKTADLWHQRAWNQLAKYVMPRPFAVSDEYVSLDTGSVRYDFGATVDVRARLLGLDGKPATGVSADALVWRDGRIVSTVSLTPDADVPGIYRGRVAALPEGEYEVSVRAAGYSDAALKARSRFVVLPPESGEMTQTSANETLLKQIAAASGGDYLREEELYRLTELLSPLSSGRVVESDTQIWQSYWWFAAIVILLTAEWGLRKRAGLL